VHAHAAEEARAEQERQTLQDELARLVGVSELAQRQLATAATREAALQTRLAESRAAEGRLELLLNATPPEAAVHIETPSPVPLSTFGALAGGDSTQSISSAALQHGCVECGILRKQVAGRTAKIATMQDSMHSLQEQLEELYASSKTALSETPPVNALEGFVPRDAVKKLFLMTQDSTGDGSDRQVALQMLCSMLELTSREMMRVSAGSTAASTSTRPPGKGSASSLADEWVRFLGQEQDASSATAVSPLASGASS
jgi:chaperonin cofactor prefoldin